MSIAKGVIDPINAPKHPYAKVNLCFKNTTVETQQCQDSLKIKLDHEITERTNLRLVFHDNCESLTDGVHISWQAEKTRAKARLVRGSLIRYDLDLICGDFSRAEAPQLGSQCISDEASLKCLLNVGLHEFMHAIGFAHEDLRPENVDRWRAMVFDGDKFVVLTEYDPNSIMNFLSYEKSVHTKEFGL